MAFRPYSVILLVFAFVIRESFPLEQVNDWNAFQGILASKKPVMLYVTDKSNDENWSAVNEYCNYYTECHCVYCIEKEKGSDPFTDHLKNTRFPAFIFYDKDGKQTQEFGMFSKGTASAKELNAAFAKICPRADSKNH